MCLKHFRISPRQFFPGFPGMGTANKKTPDPPCDRGPELEAGLALVSVFVSWTLVHTVFTLKYARRYCSGTAGGIDFNGTGAPDYPDFAYLAFTIGMTFQVSDTDIQSKAIRRTALRHAWLSFPLVAVIIATSINLVSGLAK